MFETDIGQTRFREYLYRLDDPGNKLNEILAVGDNEFLVIERDGDAGDQAKYKKIIRINTNGASEIQDVDCLAEHAIPSEILPVGKEVFIDLLDPRYGLAGDAMPEKLESLAFGPRLEDGRRTLLVVSDNDFKVDQPTRIYCFAIEENNLEKFEIR